MNDVDGFIDSIAAHVNLGHIKRDNAFLRQIRLFCEKPDGTASGGSSSMADVMSAYRFANNDNISLKQLRSVRLQKAFDSFEKEDELLMINDVSEMSYYYHDSKKDRRSIGDGNGKGYEYVCNLGVSLKNESIIGVLHDCIINEHGPDDTDTVDYHNNPLLEKLTLQDPKRLECNHKHQLACHFLHVNKHTTREKLIVVADREFDDHIIFDTIIQNNQNCVIRSNALRNVQMLEHNWISECAKTKKYQGLPQLEGHTLVDMKKLIPFVPLVEYKKIPLDSNGRHTEAHTAKSWANLAVGAFKIVLYRSFKRNKQYFNPQNYVHLNVVVVREIGPVENGRDPICWVIYTTLPIDTLDNIKKIVRIYELRWMIECFFKYLKSGYKVEFLRFTDAQKTARHLVVVSIAATFLLSIKNQLGIPNSSYLDNQSYDKIKNARKQPNNQEIPVQLRLFAYLATLGGWLGRRADPISPLTLMKGMAKLADVLQTIDEIMPLLDEWKEYRK
jgi:hypothetical protein